MYLSCVRPLVFPHSLSLLFAVPHHPLKVMLARRYLLLACSLFLVASGCESPDRETPPEPTGTVEGAETSPAPASSDDEFDIITAARDYFVEAGTENVELALEAIEGDYARVSTTTPGAPIPGLMFLQRVESGWEVLVYGPDESSFTPESLESLGVPAALQERSEDVSEVVAAARDYMGESSDVGGIDLAIEGIEGDYARVLAIPPPDEEIDPATMFLQKSDDGWEGISLGTYFGPEDFDEMGIPDALRTNGDSEDDE